MRVLLFLVFGIIVGGVARLIIPGRSPRGWATSMLIGAAGSMVGGLLASGLGLNVEGQRTGFVVSILGAVLWLTIYHLIRRRPSSRSSATTESTSSDAEHAADDAARLSQRSRALRRFAAFRPRGSRS
jgi:uncharacterized membrane protein YeaQ/YmgE (transglycosylase-associated protein family)